MKELIIRKRKITACDLKFIQTLVHENWDKGRTRISRILCQKWNWVQPNGRLKDMACRELLLTLHRKGLLEYPSPQYTPLNKRKIVKYIEMNQTPINSKLSDLEPVRVKMGVYRYPLYMLETFVEQDRSFQNIGLKNGL